MQLHHCHFTVICAEVSECGCAREPANARRVTVCFYFHSIWWMIGCTRYATPSATHILFVSNTLRLRYRSASRAHYVIFWIAMLRCRGRCRFQVRNLFIYFKWFIHGQDSDNRTQSTMSWNRHKNVFPGLFPLPGSLVCVVILDSVSLLCGRRRNDAQPPHESSLNFFSVRIARCHRS